MTFVLSALLLPEKASGMVPMT